MGMARDIVMSMDRAELTPEFAKAEKEGNLGSVQYIKFMVGFIMRDLNGTVDPHFVESMVKAEYMI